MPTVPIVQRQTQERPIGVPTSGARIGAPRLSVPDLTTSTAISSRALEGFGRDIQNAGANLTRGLLNKANEQIAEEKRMAEQAKQRADQASLLQAQTQLDEWEANSLFNRESGALTKKGINALNVPISTIQDYDNTTQEIYAGLGNDDQKLKFMQMVQSRRGNLMRTLYRHENKEIESFQNESANAAVKSAENRAMLYASDPVVSENSINNMRAAIIAKGRMNGTPNDAIQNELLERESEARKNIMVKLVDEDQNRARQYFNQFKERMVADDVQKVGKLLEAGDVRAESQNMTDKIILENETLEDQINATRNIDDPKVRDEVVKRIKDNFSLQEKIQKQDEEAIIDNAVARVQNGENPRNIPLSIWVQIPENQRSELEKYHKRLTTGEEPTEAEQWIYYDQLIQKQNGDPDYIKNAPLSEIYANAPKSKWDEIVKMRNDARKGDMGKAITVTQTNVIAKNVLQNTIGSTNDKDSARFMAAFNRELTQFETQNNRAASFADAETIANKLAIELRFDDGYFFNSSKRAFELEGDESFEELIVPEDFRKGLLDAIFARDPSATPTDEEIKQLYLQSIRGE